MRLFVALELPPAARLAAAQVLDQLRQAGTDVKWVKPQNLHVTLKFLGQVEPRLLKEVGEQTKRVCAACPALELGLLGCGAFPSPQRPTVVWLGLSGQTEALAGLAGNLEKAMEPLGFAPEARPFQPHLTLGRLRRGHSVDKSGDSRGLTREIMALAAWQGPDFAARRVSLMESTLTPTGPIYRPLKEITLT